MLIAPNGSFECEIDVTGVSGLQNFDSGEYTSEFRHNGLVDGGITLTITNPSTGRYFVSGMLPSGYANLDTCWVVILGSVDSLPVCARSESITVFTASSGGGETLAAEVWNYLTSEATTPGSVGVLVKSLLGYLTNSSTCSLSSNTNVSIQQGSYNETLTWVVPLGESSVHDWTSASLTLSLAGMPSQPPIAGTGTGALSVISQIGAFLTVQYQTTAADTASAQRLYAYLNATGPSSSWADSVSLGTVTVLPNPA